LDVTTISACTAGTPFILHTPSQPPGVGLFRVPREGRDNPLVAVQQNVEDKGKLRRFGREGPFPVDRVALEYALACERIPIKAALWLYSTVFFAATPGRMLLRPPE
jgi:hypothetical protein